MRVLLVAGSPEPSSPALVAHLAAEADSVVAVDRGADACRAAGVVPDAFCGDADTVRPQTLAWLCGREGESLADVPRLSVTPADDVREVPQIHGELAARGIRLFEPAKYDTDLSLAFSCCRQLAGEAGDATRMRAADAARKDVASAARAGVADAGRVEVASGEPRAEAADAVRMEPADGEPRMPETVACEMLGSTATLVDAARCSAEAAADLARGRTACTGASSRGDSYEGTPADALQVTVTCASAGRMDHALAVFGVLAANADLAPVLVEDAFECRVLSPRGRAFWELGPDAEGRGFSFVALADGTVVSERGMRWELDRFRVDALRDRGISNVVVSSVASVTCHEGILAAFLLR